MRTIFRDTTSIFRTRILLMIIGVGSGIIIARILGPQGKGQLYFLLAFPTIITSLIKLGVGHANTYYLGNKIYDVDDVLSGSILLSFLLGFLGIIVGILAFLFYKSLFVDIKFHLFLLVLLTIPPSLLMGYCLYIFLGLKNIQARNKFILFTPVAYSSLILVLLVFDKLKLVNVIWMNLIASFIPFIWILYYFTTHYHFRWKLNHKFILQSMKFGFVPFLTLLIMKLNYRVDVYIIKFFQPSEQLGLYSISVSWAERLWWIPQALGMVIFSRLPGMNEFAATKLTAQSNRILLSLSILFTLLYAILAVYIIPVFYGENFAGSVNPFLLLLPGIIAMVIFKVLHPYFTAKNKAKYSFIAFLVALILNIVINIILIPRFGINGASLSSTISYSIGSLILLLMFSKINKIGVQDILILKKDDILLIKEKLNGLFRERGN